MQINARPNLNGNTVDDFHSVAADLLRAVGLARKALYAAQTDVIHGRNYQTAESPDAARGLDLQTIQQAWAAAQTLAEFADAVAEATWARGADA